MVNPITGEMSFEERTKESWKKEEAKEQKIRAAEKGGVSKKAAQKPARAEPGRKEVAREEPKEEKEVFDYFQEKQAPPAPFQEATASSYFTEPEVGVKKEEKASEVALKPRKQEEKKESYGFALDELEDDYFAQKSKEKAQGAREGGVIPNSLFD